MDLLNSVVTVFSSNSVLFITSIASFAFYWLKERFSYWKRIGVPSTTPLQCFSPIRFFLGRVHMLDILMKMHFTLPEAKFSGAWVFHQPFLIIRDPEIARLFLIKGFPNFHDRHPPDNEVNDETIGNLFLLTGKKWRPLRYKLLPAFSETKLKIMFESLRACAIKLNTYLDNLTSNMGVVEIDVNKLMSNYTSEVTGSCVMGIKCNALNDPNCEVKKNMGLMFRFHWRQLLFMLSEILHQRLPKLFGLRLVHPELVDFLTRVVRGKVERETDQSVIRKDFLHIMSSLRHSDLEARAKEETEEQGRALPQETGRFGKEEDMDGEGEGPLFSESVTTGVMSSFLSEGFELVSSALTFALHELAHNPEAQEKMFDEIQSLKFGLDNDIQYESLKKFKYTDQIINETLRRRPVVPGLGRICTEPFLIPGTSAVVERGTRVLIVTYAMHRDPTYFPEPERFDPDRFSDKNIDKIVPGSYLPFGDGPRFCIAMRLARMDIKLALITIVSKFKILPSTKTPKDLKYDKKMFTLSADGPVWLRLEKRE